jgi:ankyrin repeat protein
VVSLLVPQAVALALAAVVVAGWLAGADPFWPLPEVTLAEAVVTRDYAEIVRLIEHGADPNQPARVRVDMLNSAEHTLTPLEAAVGTRAIELVRLLVRHGASVGSGSSRACLICEAIRVDAPDIVDFLLTTDDRSDPRGGCPAISESN